MQPVDLSNPALVNATGIVGFAPNGISGSIKKVPTRGHGQWALTTKKPDANAATVKLKGTNNPDPADTNGEDLITNTHVGNDQKDGSVASKGYKYVFVEVTAIAGGEFAVGSLRLHGTGQGSQ